MAKLSMLAGSTSQSVNVFIQDNSVSSGAGLTGLVFNTASLTAYYSFAGAIAASTSISLVTLATLATAYASGGFKEVDATNMPGVYRLDLPNAVLAASKGRSVVVLLRGATNMAPCVLELELTGTDNQDAVHGGMSAIPNTACTTNASLLTSGTGTDQISAAAGKLLLQATQTGVTIPTVTNVGTLTTYTGDTPQTGDSFARIGATGSGLTTLAPASTALSTANWTTARAGKLDNLDAAVSTRSTYAGADTSGTTTLLGRLTSGRATNLDNLDAAVSTRSTYAGGVVAGVSSSVTVGTNNDKAGYMLASTGLDSIAVTATTGLATTFPAMVVQVWRRFFKSSAKAVSGLTIKQFADDGAAVLVTQTYADDGAGNETLSAGA